MNGISSFRYPKMLKREMEKLISFEEKDDLIIPQKRAKDQAPDTVELLSKYARVLSCSFVTPTGKPAG